jgi:transcription antitermination protein NusB
VIVDKQAIKARRLARRLALQVLYQWLMSGEDLVTIQAQTLAFNAIDKVDVDYFNRLISGIQVQLNEVEAAFSVFLDRPLQQLNPIEHTILRMSAYELLYMPEIPYKIVLDESINLARTFGAEEGHRYVNGVLHHLAQKVRAVEIEAFK